MRIRTGALLIAITACGGSSAGPPPDAAMVGDGGLRILGEPHTGNYHLGPVEWTGSFHNACAPYPAAVQRIEGGLLAGLSNEVAATGDYCDACVYIETGAGHSAILRVVTYGVSNAPGDMDVSQAAFDQLNIGEDPRAMTWRLVECPTAAPLQYQFQTGANIDWTSLWVRNPRTAIAQVEVMSARHASWFALRRASDGTLTDAGGFGAGAFTLRVTAVDGGQVEQTFPGFTPGALVVGDRNLP
jgi:hypothetical protein